VGIDVYYIAPEPPAATARVGASFGGSVHWGSPRWRTIVQQAVVTVLSAIYEEDFIGPAGTGRP